MREAPPAPRSEAWGLRLAGLVAAGLAGTALQLQQPGLWSAVVYAGLLFCAAAAGWWGLRSHRWPALVLGLGMALFAMAGLRAHVRLAELLPSVLEGEELELTGVVAGLPRSAATGTRFPFEVEQARWRDRPVAVPPRVWLSWPQGADDDGVLPMPRDQLQAGQRWRWTARLRAPHGTLNPAGFDFELWCFEQGLGATGSVRAAPAPVRLADAAGFPVERARQSLRDAVQLRVADPRSAGVLVALLVGDQAAIGRADWALFRDSGVAHLMSISGLHVTMFAWLAGGLVGWGWRRWPRAVLACPAPLAARWSGVLAAAAYAQLAGGGVPAQRTVWMLALAALLASLGLRWPWPLVLGVAALAVVALDPWALLQPGFWLSFVAVGMLLAAGPGRPAAPGRWSAVRHALRSGLRTQWLATLGLAPLSLVLFQQVSLVGLLANLVAIPLVTLLIVPLALAGALAPPLWTAAAALVEGLLPGLQALAAWPGAVWTGAAAPAWAQAVALLGGALLLVPLPWRVRALGGLMCLPLLWPAPDRPADGRFDVIAPDVGQGSALLLRTRQHLLVYDTGPVYGPDSDAGERVLLPLLRARGERRIDRLVLSHRDTDHVGGAAALLAQLPVGELRGSLPDGHPLRAAGVPWSRCEAGQRWSWDGVDFEVLHPTPAEVERAPPANALSCVLRVQDAAGRSLLLTGDIGAAQEAALLARGAALRSRVLLVPHHGSHSSSSTAFVAAVGPEVALVQAGYRNRFGHPRAEVVARYEAGGAALVRSDRCGAWTWRDDTMTCWRHAARRYWQHRPDGVEVASQRLPSTGRRDLWPSMSR